MKDVVNYGSRTQQQYIGNHGGIAYKFTKTVGKTQMTVIAERKADECWLITGYINEI